MPPSPFRGRGAAVQAGGCGAVFAVAHGTDGEALARKEVAAASGILELTVAAMDAHPRDAAVQNAGCRALLVVSFGSDGRKKAAAAAGAARAVADAMASFPSYPQLQRWGVRALLTLAAGDLPDAAATPVRWEEARTPYDA